MNDRKRPPVPGYPTTYSKGDDPNTRPPPVRHSPTLPSPKGILPPARSEESAPEAAPVPKVPRKTFFPKSKWPAGRISSLAGLVTAILGTGGLAGFAAKATTETARLPPSVVAISGADAGDVVRVVDQIRVMQAEFRNAREEIRLAKEELANLSKFMQKEIELDREARQRATNDLGIRMATAERRLSYQASMLCDFNSGPPHPTFPCDFVKKWSGPLPGYHAPLRTTDAHYP